MMSRPRDADAPVPFEEAIARVSAEIVPLPSEALALGDAYGRVLAEDVRASHPLPPFDNSAVDGFAVRAADVAAATAEHPVTLVLAGTSAAGSGVTPAVGPGRAVRILTGAPMPEGADALVMQEWTEWNDTTVAVRRAAAPGRNVRRAGDDVKAGETVLRAGRTLGPAEVGMLAALGVDRPRVGRRPEVALLVTGDELLDPHEALRPGRIRSANDWVLAGALDEAGATIRRLGIARDTLEDLQSRIRRAHDADVLVTSGGVSVGDRDLLGPALERLGFRRIFWRVLSSPGKPLLFGRLGRTLVFALPGNPVSALVAFENFVRPSLRRMQGDTSPGRARLFARVEAPIEGPPDRRHFARVRLSVDASGARVREVPPPGSGNLGSLLRANALAVLPEGCARVDAGEVVETILLRDPEATAAPAS